MGTVAQELATAVYRQAARFSAHILGRSPVVKSILLHRSAATGEVAFGRSDIDLMMLVDDRSAEDGESLAALYRTVRGARWANPVLSHVDVYEPGELAAHFRMDTFLASVERRAQLLLYGEHVEIPCTPVQPEHSLNRLLLSIEWFFAVAVQQRNTRNLRKLALEVWDAYAVATGLMAEPCLQRSEMAAQARRFEAGIDTEQLGEPSRAARFVLELADRLHRARLKPLGKLAKPLCLEVITPPLCLRRLLVVLPSADTPLPPQAFIKGAFLCTPEFLDLFVQTKNAFIHWILPPELLDLGISPPDVCGFSRSCRFYGHSRFLYHPGFAGSGVPMQAARMAVIRHAAEWVLRGEVPAAVSQQEIQEAMAACRSTISQYYYDEFVPLRRETRRIQEALAARSASAGRP